MADIETPVDSPWETTLQAGVGGGATASIDLPRGRVIGRYVVIAVAGRGGMGVVYRAYDPELDRQVAIKLLAQPLLQSELAQARLRREAQAMAKVSHPNVLPVYDVGAMDGHVWIAMEYLPAETLAGWIERAPRSHKEIVAMYVQAGRGLAAAHQAGLVHRDFKPANVLVTQDRRARVMDLGLARGIASRPARLSLLADSTTPGSQLAGDLSATGTTVGTPRYMAPEQHPGRPVDGRADQFSFCVALYEALTGVRAFAGRDLEELAAHKCRGDIVAPSAGVALPRRLRRVLLRGMSAAPEQRYCDMDALLAELQADPWIPRRRWGMAAGLVAFFAMSISLAMSGPATSTTEPCSDGDRKLRGVWDPTRKAEIKAAIDASGLPYAETTWTTLEQVIDRRTSSWLDARHGACAATEIHGEQSPQLMDLRMTCLDRAHDELRQFLDMVAMGEPTVLERTVSTAATLPNFAGCGAVEELQAEDMLPEDSSRLSHPGHRALRQALRPQPPGGSSRAREPRRVGILGRASE